MAQAPSPAPGVTFTVLPSPIPGAAGPLTGQWFVAGAAQRGPLGKSIGCQSINDFATTFGGPVSFSPLYSAAEKYFRDGGSQLFVSRYDGPGATSASLQLKDSAGNVVATVTANGPGTWANGTSGIQVAVLAGPTAGTFVIQVSFGGYTTTSPIETSPPLASPTDIATWATLYSKYVTASPNPTATTLPAVAGVAPMAGGTYDIANITDTQRAAALSPFISDLGPGQISIPGATTSAAYSALIAAAAATNRRAILDGPDTPVAATAITAAQTAQLAAQALGIDGLYFFMAGGAWDLAPGLPSTGTLPAPPRAIPPSAMCAALMARNDAATGNPNLAAAGDPEGVSNYSLGVTQTFSDADRAALNTAGVNLIRTTRGKTQLYGFRSGSTDPNWVQFSWSRLLMAIAEDCYRIGGTVAEFGQIDGRGHLYARVGGAVAGVLLGYYDKDALYGNTPADAFNVNVGPGINTVAEAAAAHVDVVIAVRMSPFAEQAQEFFVKVPIAQAISA